MKKIYFLLICLILTTSCEKEFLNKTPLDRISDDAVWSDPGLIDAYIFELYFELPLHSNPNGWDWNPGGAAVYFPMVVTDEARQHGTYWHAYTLWNQGLMDESHSYNNWWGYNIVRKMNEFLERIETSPLNEENIDLLKAEVRFLRAYAYFELVKRYGAVPLITIPQSIDASEEELFVSRNSEKEIYDFIYNELIEVAPILPETRGSNDYGRATRYAAIALNCRAMLYAASLAEFGQQQLNGLLGFPSSEAVSYWQKAYDEAQKIIDYSESTGSIGLYNKYPEDKVKNFYQLFIDERNIETIFPVVYNGLNNVGHSFDFWVAIQGFSVGWGNEVNVLLELVESFDYIDGTPGTLDRDSLGSGSYDITSLFAEKDPRFHASVLFQDVPWQGRKVEMYSGTWVNENGNEVLLTDPGATYMGKPVVAPSGGFYGVTGFIPKKYYDERLLMPQWFESETDYLVFRYGEILLNYAEAAFELGLTDDALWGINQIRARAGIALLESVTRDQIRKERRVELAFEGHRIWDVRRWRTAVNDLSGDFTGLRYYLEAETGKYRIQFVDQVDGYSRLFLEKHYYLPIGPDRLSNNPNLAPENPGY